MSKELTQHPVHLVGRHGESLPSAFIPFCAYQSSALGQRIKELNFTACNSFKPTVLTGQLCYSIEPPKAPTKAGKNFGLLLIIDPHTSQNTSNSPAKMETPAMTKMETPQEPFDKNRQGPFKIYLHTLSKSTDYRQGAYSMRSLKKFTGTKSFQQMQDKARKCHFEEFEKCQTKTFLLQVQQLCQCMPWTLTENDDNEQVNKSLSSINHV